MFTSCLRVQSLSLVLGVSSLLNACASSPPPQPVKQVERWSGVVKLIDYTKAGGGGGQAPKTFKTVHELWSQSEEAPPLSRIEVTLAATGVLAESNGSEGRYQISVEEGQCVTEWLKVNQALESSRVERTSQCQEQLKREPMDRLRGSKAMMKLRCKGGSGAGVVELYNIAVAVSKAIQTPEAVEGERVTEQYPAPTWVNPSQRRCGLMKKINQYLTRDHLSYERVQLKDQSWAIWTRGLKGFGLSEIGLLRVTPNRLESAESRLLAAADFILRVEGLKEGQVITSGSARGMFVNAQRVQERQDDLGDLPQRLSEAMLIVDPEAETKDLEAQRKLTMKLTLP